MGGQFPISDVTGYLTERHPNAAGYLKIHCYGTKRKPTNSAPMNRFYDMESAKQHTAKANEESRTKGQSNGIHIGNAKVDAYKVITTKYPPSSRLVTEQGMEQDEVVFKVRGILCGKLLPPVHVQRGGLRLGQIRNLRQQVKVTGFDDEGFNAMQEVLNRVHTAFQDALIDSSVKELDFIPYEGFYAIDSHARYFTDRGLVPYEKNNEFLPFVDPSNALRRIQPDSFIHASDNQVEYCVIEMDEEGEERYRPLNPSIMKIGDLVEIAFSCVAIPIKNKQHKILLQLRAVSLLSSTLRTESEALFTKAGNVVESFHRPKRKATFLDETEVENTRKRLHEMTIATS